MFVLFSLLAERERERERELAKVWEGFYDSVTNIWNIRNVRDQRS
jgi:hypothetical protein